MSGRPGLGLFLRTEITSPANRRKWLAIAVVVIATAWLAIARPGFSDDAGSASDKRVLAELWDKEKPGYHALVRWMPRAEASAFFAFTDKLEVGNRGRFAAALVKRPPSDQKQMLRYLAGLDARQRKVIAKAFDDPQRRYVDWASFFALVAKLRTGDAIFISTAVIEQGPAAQQASNLIEEFPLYHRDLVSDFEFGWMPGGGMAGGYNVDPGHARWQVQIFRSGNAALPYTPIEVRRELDLYDRRRDSWERVHNCGGALIGSDGSQSNWVLTAAHCVNDPTPSGPYLENRKVRTGTLLVMLGGTEWTIDAAVVHADYNTDLKANDIALLRISNPVVLPQNLSSSVKIGVNGKGPVQAPRDIPVAGAKDAPLRDGELLEATGWGGTLPMGPDNAYRDAEGRSQRASPWLQQVDLKVTSLASCAAQPLFAAKKVKVVPEGEFCAVGVARYDWQQDPIDACNGDSGGPVIRNGKNGPLLVGLVSFGVGCAVPGLAAVYTDVRHYADWIAAAKTAAVPGKVIRYPSAR